MNTEDALFKLADALIGVASEHGSVSRYISNKDFSDCMIACEKLNKKRYDENIAIYL